MRGYNKWLNADNAAKYSVIKCKIISLSKAIKKYEGEQGVEEIIDWTFLKWLEKD